MVHSESLTVRVPASTSNLGAGFDFVGLALDIWLSAGLREGNGPPVYRGTLAGFDAEDDFLVAALGESMPAGFFLEVSSEIPVGRGLGSSATALVAGLSLAQLLRHGKVDRAQVFSDATAKEGHPDNAGPAVYGGLFFHAGFPRRLVFHETLGIALAIPEQVLSTKEARAVLPTHLHRAAAISQASGSAALLLGLTSGDGDLIRHGMVDNIAVPKRQSMIHGYDDAVQAGIGAGAFGVTISGAGSTLVAVCKRDHTRHVAQTMADAMTARGNTATALCPNVVEGGLEVVGG